MSFELPAPGSTPGFNDLASAADRRRHTVRAVVEEAFYSSRGDIAGHIKLAEPLDKFCTDLSMLLTWNKNRDEFRFVKRATKTAAFVAQQILEPVCPPASAQQLLDRRDSGISINDFAAYMFEGPQLYLTDRILQLELIDRSNAHLRDKPKDFVRARYIGGLVHMQIDEAMYAAYAHDAATEFADALQGWNGDISQL